MKIGLGGLEKKFLYHEYRRRLDAEAVLCHYGAENMREVQGPDGTTEIIHSCLLDRVEPHHTHGDQNPSASCNLDRKVYVCYSYWGGDLFHLIAKLEGKENLADIVPLIGDFLSGATVSSQDFTDKMDAFFVKESYSIELPAYSEKVIEPWLFSHPYLRERGVSWDASSQLKIGYDSVENRIVFPHYWDSRLVGWQKRVLPDSPGWPGTRPDYPKYRNSSGFPKSETLYNFKRRSKGGGKTIVVVESPMSVAKAVSLGIPNVVATFGAKISTTQIDLLSEFDEVIIWMDNDPAGHSAEKKLVNGLCRPTNAFVVSSDKDKDLADYNAADLVQEKIDCAMPAILKKAQWDYEKRYRG